MLIPSHHTFPPDKSLITEPWLACNLPHRSGWPYTQISTCHGLPRAGIKGVDTTLLIPPQPLLMTMKLYRRSQVSSEETPLPEWTSTWSSRLLGQNSPDLGSHVQAATRKWLRSNTRMKLTRKPLPYNEDDSPSLISSFMLCSSPAAPREWFKSRKAAMSVWSLPESRTEVIQAD